jgi:hypothetical protein
MSEDYTTYSGFGIALTFTPASGTYGSLTIALDGAHKITLPGRKKTKGLWVPQTGDKKGVQQSSFGYQPRETAKFTTPYQPARRAQLDAIVGVKGTLVVTMANGDTQTCADAAIEDTRLDELGDTPPALMTVLFDVNGDWVLGSATVAAFTQPLTSGAATLDLTNLGGVDGAGKVLACLMVAAPATNGNPITIAKGATNGYAGLGATWSAVVAPGQDARFYAVPAAAVIGNTNKTLDLTGTGAQVLSGAAWFV